MWRSGWEGMIFSVVATVSCKHRGGKLSEVNGKKLDISIQVLENSFRTFK